MKEFFGYLRVSTPKQGEGVSLTEQRAAIQHYADRMGIKIAKWYIEVETAAKRGRSVFTSMLKDVRNGNADGIVIHKIDRSARNLKDWADLGDLKDEGYEVHFAFENLDLDTRGGRLSADIQAVVSADFIRNLREETRKGFYGRLKQGLYPMRAPLGYINKGRGKPKVPDPKTAPLVAKAFELYATGNYTLNTLLVEMHQLGLRNLGGQKLSINGLSTILNNPFYTGLIRLKKTNETYQGIHEPIVSTTTFTHVHAKLTGKTNTRYQKHAFLYRRMITCKHCGYSLIGEKQKGFTYYRCQTKACPTLCIREEFVDAEVHEKLSAVALTDKELQALHIRVNQFKDNTEKKLKDTVKALELNRTNLMQRLDRLIDAYVDQLIEKDVFEQRRNALLMEKQTLEEKLNELQSKPHVLPQRLSLFLEQAKAPQLAFKTALPEEKRDLLKSLSSNRLADGKDVAVELRPVFHAIANRSKLVSGDPSRRKARIDFDALFAELVRHAI